MVPMREPPLCGDRHCVTNDVSRDLTATMRQVFSAGASENLPSRWISGETRQHGTPPAADASHKAA